MSEKLDELLDKMDKPQGFKALACDFEHMFGVPWHLDDPSKNIEHYPQLSNLGIEKDNAVEILEYLNEIIKKHYEPLEELIYVTYKSRIIGIWEKSSELRNIEEREEFERKLNDFLYEAAKWEAVTCKETNECYIPDWIFFLYSRLVGFLCASKARAKCFDNVFPFAIRSKEFNGWTIFHDYCSIIALDYSLEPLLKFMNIVFYQLFIIKEKSGKTDLSLLTRWLLPLLLYFIRDIRINRLPFVCLLNTDDLMRCKDITAKQITFLLAHEIGHIMLKHNSKSNLSTAIYDQRDKDVITSARILRYNRDWLLEFDADEFAFNLFKTACFNRLQVVEFKNETEEASSDWDVGSIVHDWLSFRISIELLFLFVSLTEKLSNLLKSRIRGFDTLPSAESHPPASERLNRLREFHYFDLGPDIQFIPFVENISEEWFQYYSSFPTSIIENQVREIEK